MSDDLVVRPATAADDSALLAVERTGWTSGSGFPSYQHGAGDRFFTDRRRPEGFLVAELGGRIVAHAAVRAKHPFAEGAHVQALWGLVVDPGVRRRGVAAALLHAAEELARSRGARKLSLQVLGSNTAALALYERHGYTVEGRCRDEFLIDGVPVDDVSLTKLL